MKFSNTSHTIDKRVCKTSASFLQPITVDHISHTLVMNMTLLLKISWGTDWSASNQPCIACCVRTISFPSAGCSNGCSMLAAKLPEARSMQPHLSGLKKGWRIGARIVCVEMRDNPVHQWLPRILQTSWGISDAVSSGQPSVEKKTNWCSFSEENCSQLIVEYEWI